MSLKLLCIFWGGFHLTFTVQGQNSLSVQGLYNNATIRNTAFSALPYNSSLPGASFTGTLNRNRLLHEFTILYASGTSKKKKQATGKINQHVFNADYCLLFPVSGSIQKKLILKAGAKLQLMHTCTELTDFINNNEAFETAFSAGAAFTAAYNPAGKLKKFFATGSFSVPVIISYAQQPYSGSYTAGNGLNGKSEMSAFFSDNVIVFIPDFFRLKSSFKAGWRITPKHAAGFAFSWDYYKISSAKPVSQLSSLTGIFYTCQFN